MTRKEAINILRNTAWLGTVKQREKVEEALETLAEDATLPLESLAILSIACREHGITNDQLYDFVNMLRKTAVMVTEKFNRDLEECLRKAITRDA